MIFKYTLSNGRSSTANWVQRKRNPRSLAHSTSQPTNHSAIVDTENTCFYYDNDSASDAFVCQCRNQFVVKIVCATTTKKSMRIWVFNSFSCIVSVYLAQLMRHEQQQKKSKSSVYNNRVRLWTASSRIKHFAPIIKQHKTVCQRSIGKCIDNLSMAACIRAIKCCRRQPFQYVACVYAYAFFITQIILLLI